MQRRAVSIRAACNSIECCERLNRLVRSRYHEFIQYKIEMPDIGVSATIYNRLVTNTAVA